MITLGDVKCGTRYTCTDGLSRYAVMIHRPGNGFGVTWDTVDPRQQNYYGDSVAMRKREKEGQRGYTAMHKFLRLATGVEQ